MMESHWLPVKESGIPLHQQIYDHIKLKIENGEWTVGTRIPTQRELASQFKVNRSTIVYALDELTADGLIESKVGKGTFVINNTWSLLASAPPPDWNSYVKSGVYQPNIQTIQDINQAEANPHMIRLGTGELSPDLLPHTQTKALFQQESTSPFSMGYPEPKGDPHLRELVSMYLKKKGIEASPSSILIVSGGLQGLQLISLGLLHRGSTIFHENPSYLNSVHVFQSAGMNLHGIPVDHQGMVSSSISRLKKMYNGALLYTTPSFHNPTGVLMSETRRNEVLNICTSEKLPIIEDDVYGDLYFEEPPPPPLKSKDSQGLVLYMGSMSKTLGPGLRIGWVVGPEPVINRLADIKMQTDYGSSSLSQYAVSQWLASGQYENYIKDIRQNLKNRRNFTLEILNAHFKDIATWTVPTGGFFIWLKLTASPSTEKLFKKSLQEGILLNPGTVYDRSDQQHLRLSYAYASLPQLEKGLVRVAEMIKEG
ncbi:PLP-dependent aminotransferase family protein [Fictibacillus enclensis]|uniref:MocR-like pyridoxine biosynthesis transcription factor PdxR n=1 Tax=Fictibacillus enclensis TaxID=1017270 RepID=UPI0025A1724F|nr:PLP-dependent aminotransferase family protein [Fictibacillus enclensis]MDM5336333.1 PLP-dependent aminotransferase family protein [Fictibacillus enclensis]